MGDDNDVMLVTVKASNHRLNAGLMRARLCEHGSVYHAIGRVTQNDNAMVKLAKYRFLFITIAKMLIPFYYLMKTNCIIVNA